MNEVKIKRRYWLGYRTLPIGDPLRDRVENLFRNLEGMHWEINTEDTIIAGIDYCRTYKPNETVGLTITRKDTEMTFPETDGYGPIESHNFSVKDGDKRFFDGEKVEFHSGIRRTFTQTGIRVKTYIPGPWEQRLDRLHEAA